jgi:hypothetical protein
VSSLISVVVSALNHDGADEVVLDNKKLEGELLRLQDEPALEVATHPFPISNSSNTSVALHNAAIIAQLCRNGTRSGLLPGLTHWRFIHGYLEYDLSCVIGCTWLPRFHLVDLLFLLPFSRQDNVSPTD